MGIASVLWGDSFSTVRDSFSTVEVVQYSGGITSVHAGDSFSTVEVAQYCRGIASVLWRFFSTVGDKISTCRGITSHRGIETNRSRIGSKFGWYGKVNQKSSRFANVPFHSHMSKNAGPVQVHFPDLLGFYGYMQVHFSYSLPVY